MLWSMVVSGATTFLAAIIMGFTSKDWESYMETESVIAHDLIIIHVDVENSLQLQHSVRYLVCRCASESRWWDCLRCHNSDCDQVSLSCHFIHNIILSSAFSPERLSRDRPSSNTD